MEDLQYCEGKTSSTSKYVQYCREIPSVGEEGASRHRGKLSQPFLGPNIDGSRLGQIISKESLHKVLHHAINFELTTICLDPKKRL